MFLVSEAVCSCAQDADDVAVNMHDYDTQDALNDSGDMEDTKTSTESFASANSETGLMARAYESVRVSQV